MTSTTHGGDRRQTLDESTFRDKVRESLQRGKLPDRRPDRVWGGASDGAECAVCEGRVARDEVELELEFHRNGPGSGFDTYHVHVRCHAAWQSERERLLS